MATAIDSTQWPAITVPSVTKQLISRLFSLVESKDGTVGDQLANDLFTPNGKFLTPHSNATGSAEILHCRDNVWGSVKSRKHRVTKVYASDTEGMDLLLLGEIDSESKDGNKSTVGFAARLVFDRTSSEQLRIKLYQASGFTGGSH